MAEHKRVPGVIWCLCNDDAAELADWQANLLQIWGQSRPQEML